MFYFAFFTKIHIKSISFIDKRNIPYSSLIITFIPLSYQNGFGQFISSFDMILLSFSHILRSFFVINAIFAIGR